VGFFVFVSRKVFMLWITALGFAMAAALVKLGVALVMVSILTTALWGAGACLLVLLSLVVWLAWRR
jgi:Na+/H+ antiporter NhaD/arsenite permease-like protein